MRSELMAVVARWRRAVRLTMIGFPLAAAGWGALSADTPPGVSVQAIGSDLAVGRTSPGEVRFFRQDPVGQWREYDRIVPDSVPASARFGQALGGDGDWLAVGAPGMDDGGVVCLYRRSDSGWVDIGRIGLLSNTAGDDFGSVLLLRGRELFIGAPGH